MFEISILVGILVIAIFFIIGILKYFRHGYFSTPDFWHSTTMVGFLYIFIFWVTLGVLYPDQTTFTSFKTTEISKTKDAIFVYKDGLVLGSDKASDVNSWDTTSTFYIKTEINMYGKVIKTTLTNKKK